MQEQDNFETLEAAGTVEEAAEAIEEEAVVSDTGEELAREFRAEADEGDVDAAESRPKVKKLFTLNFALPLEDYLDFYRIMNAANVKKSKKKMTIMGAVEIVVGLLLVLSVAMGYSKATPLSWVLLAIIFLLGFRQPLLLQVLLRAGALQGGQQGVPEKRLPAGKDADRLLPQQMRRAHPEQDGRDLLAHDRFGQGVGGAVFDHAGAPPLPARSEIPDRAADRRGGEVPRGDVRKL